jgi:hypothetical protein
MFDLSDPKAFWLTVTNIGLGIVAVSFAVYVIPAIVRDLWRRIWHHGAYEEPEVVRKAS